MDMDKSSVKSSVLADKVVERTPGKSSKKDKKEKEEKKSSKKSKRASVEPTHSEVWSLPSLTLIPLASSRSKLFSPVCTVALVSALTCAFIYDRCYPTARKEAVGICWSAPRQGEQRAESRE
jgi:hypothetical protein